LLVCRSGNRSGKACDLLAKHGLAGGTNLAGGMIEWNRRGLPVVREPLSDAVAILDALAVWLTQVLQMPRADADALVRAGLPPEPRDATGAELARAIAGLERQLQENGVPPADLDLVCAAFASDAARLGGSGSAA